MGTPEDVAAEKYFTPPEKKQVELPSEDEIKEWIDKTFAHFNPEFAPFFYMGIEALYVKLGGNKFLTITIHA